MKLVIEYRIDGYTFVDAFRPKPKWGKRIFHVDTDDIGTTDMDEIILAAIDTAPDGYKCHSCRAL